MSLRHCVIALLLAAYITCVINTQEFCDSENGEDSEECNKYANSERMPWSPWVSMPDNEQDLERMYRERRLNHPAFSLAYDSAKIKRSTKQAFILLLGLTGSGKSSTINYLFDKYIATTSDKRAETKDTTEYSVSMTSDDFRISELKLTIIDTPGFADTEGLEQDAKNLVSIQQFLQKHPFLRTKFPNIIYLVVKINDNRMFGPDSQFSKLLKILPTLDAIDKQNNNLIVVLSHAASMGRNAIVWKEKVEQKIQDVKAHVESFLGVIPYVVAQETQTDEWGLEKDGDWHVLPDGRLQPKQLFEVSKSLLLNANDGLGYEAFRLCFRPKTKFEVAIGFTVSSKQVDKSAVTKMQAKLMQKVIVLSDSEVSKLLDEYYEKKDMPTLYHDILNLKIRFNDLDLKEPRDLQRLSMNQLKGLMLPTHMTSQMEKIITDLFGLKFEELAGHFNQIGKGFNPFTDSFTYTFPLELGEDSGGKLGLSSKIQLYDTNSYDIRYQSLSNYNQYILERLSELKISSELGINFGSFTMKVREGYNVRDSSSFSSEQKQDVNSFLIEQKIYKYTVKQPFEISKALRQDITSLPPTYNKNDEKNVQSWQIFFDKWGYYAVIGGYLGGSVTGQVKSETGQSNSFNSEEIQRELAMKMSFLRLGGEVSYGTSVTNREISKQKSTVTTTSLKWLGGDRSVFKNSLDDLSIQDWNRWVNSLEYTPEPLWTSLDLYALYHLVGEVDMQKAREMQKITNHALSGQFKYEPPKKETRESISQPKRPKICFPADAKVWLSDGTALKMTDIMIGHKVLSSDDKGFKQEDEVISWIHRHNNQTADFLEIKHELGKVIISPGHILYVGNDKIPKTASEVKVGDKLYFRKSFKDVFTQLVTITAVKNVQRSGIFSPLTWSGNLIVDGIDVSNYADVHALTIFGKEIVSSQTIAHFGFLPLRLAHIIGFNINQNKIDSVTGMHLYAKWLLENVSEILNFVVIELVRF